jgi:hypothetical protein
MNEPHDTEEGTTPDSSGQSRIRNATEEDLARFFGSGGVMFGSLYGPRASTRRRTRALLRLSRSTAKRTTATASVATH